MITNMFGKKVNMKKTIKMYRAYGKMVGQTFNPNYEGKLPQSKTSKKTDNGKDGQNDN